MSNTEFDILDILSVLSFLISVKNLDLNLTQNDKQDLMKELNKETSILLDEIHGHLAIQDEKLNIILEELKNVGILQKTTL